MPRVTIKKCLWVALILALTNLFVFYTRMPAQNEDTISQRDTDNPHVMGAGLSNSSYRHYRHSKHDVIPEVQTFTSLADAQGFMESHDLRDVNKIVIRYPNFTRNMPNFITWEDKEIFMKSKRNQGNFKPITTDMLIGEVQVIRNATFQMFYDCGYKSEASFFTEPRIPTQGKSFDILCPLVIPMGYLFQHFYDGTLPKISQVHGFLKQPDVKVLLEQPYHPSIYAMLKALGITKDRIVWHERSDSTTVYHAKYMVTTCVTPPLHPVLWKRGRRLLGVPDTLQLPHRDALVMYLTRAGATNAGRRAINSQEVEDFLRYRYSDRLLVFKGGYQLDEAIHVFSRVKVIIGTHGGAFYNMNFAPLNTTIIEFVPTLQNGKDIGALPHAIFWAMADLLGQPYWRVPCLSANIQHDMVVDIDKLRDILNKVDPV